jgi:hypothetical protein
MAETTFGVKYDGPALADGRMPVRDLAPALLALGELFTEASTAIYPDRPPVALDIHATNEGSFSVDLILSGIDGAWEATEQLFGGDGVSALVNLKEIIIGGVGGSSYGLLEFIKWLRGRSTESDQVEVVPAIEPGVVRVTMGDSSVEVPEQVLALQKRVTVRRSVKEIVRPLERPDVDCFEAISEEEVTLSVSKPDLSAFDAIEAPEEEEELPETERDAIVQIAGIFWGAKWMFSEGGGSPFYATIEDPEFLEAIAKGIEAFRQGDLLECTLRMQQRRVGAQLKAEYQIVKVTKHIAAAEQLTTDGLEAESEPDAA